ncbi:MAG: TolC family protein [Acidobacteria bacterium]|nr:TolC family protein [Acidobacteriota bacterium]
MMNLPRYLLILLLLMAGHTPATAQETAAAEPLTLSTAARIALNKNPRVQVAAHDLHAAQAQVKQARAMFLPRVDFRETFTNGNNPVYVFGTLLGQKTFSEMNFSIPSLNEPDPLNNFKSEVTLYQSIWEGGKIRAQNRIANLNEQIQVQEQELTRQQVIFDVVRHYYAVQLSRQRTATAEAALHSAEANAKRIQDLLDNGLVVKSDLLRIQVFQAEMQQALFEAENQLQLSRAALDADLGRDYHAYTTYELATPLEKIQVSLPDERSLLDQALQNRPEVLTLRSAITIAENQVRHAQGDYLPGVGFFSTLEYNVGTQADARGGNYLLGVQLRWNIFDGFAKGARVAENRSRQYGLEMKLDHLTDMISLQIKDNYLRMRTAHQQYEVAAAAVSQAEEALRITRDRYESGLATLTDLLASETALTGARTRLSQAQYQYNVAYANLELSAGTLTLNSPLFQ